MITMDGKMYVDLGGEDGNAFSLMGLVSGILRDLGRKDDVKTVIFDMKSSDYEHLLKVMIREIGDYIVLVNVPDMYYQLLEDIGANIH